VMADEPKPITDEELAAIDRAISKCGTDPPSPYLAEKGRFDFTEAGPPLGHPTTYETVMLRADVAQRLIAEVRRLRTALREMADDEESDHPQSRDAHWLRSLAGDPCTDAQCSWRDKEWHRPAPSKTPAKDWPAVDAAGIPLPCRICGRSYCDHSLDER
jgi:hypothetical protein